MAEGPRYRSRHQMKKLEKAALSRFFDTMI